MVLPGRSFDVSGPAGLSLFPSGSRWSMTIPCAAASPASCRSRCVDFRGMLSPTACSKACMAICSISSSFGGGHAREGRARNP